MDIQTEKIKIVQTILDTDDIAIIQAVNEVLQQTQTDDSEELIGSKPDGTPLTRADLKEGLAIAKQQYKEGKYSTFEELVEKWDIQL